MKRIVSSVSFLVLSGSVFAQGQTPLESCFPKINFSNQVLTCRLETGESETTLVLKGGKALTVFQDNKKRTLRVTQVTHLEPRLSDVGALDESTQFEAKNFMGSYTVTLDVPCRQTIFAAVSLNSSDGEIKEHIAGCELR